MKKYLALSTLSAVMLLSGCSKPETLTFTPKTGESHSYHVLVQSDLSVNGGRQHQLTTDMLLRFKVKDTQPDYQFDLFYDYFDAEVDGSSVLSSNKAAVIERLKPILGPGFSLNMDAKTGRITSVKLNGDDKNQKLPQAMVKRLTDQLSAPGMLANIPLKVGATLPLGDFNNQQATLTVKAVTKDRVTVYIEGQMPQKKLFAQVVLNRHSGWVKSMVLVTQGDIVLPRVTANGTTIVMMMPKDSHNVQPLQFGGAAEKELSSHLYNINDVDPLYANADLKTVVKSQPSGFFINDHLYFFYPLHGMSAGRLSAGNITAYSKDGKPYPFEMWSSDPYYAQPYQNMARFNLHPKLIGWPSYPNDLTEPTYLKADLTYHPMLLKSATVDWQPGKAQQFDVAGQIIHIKPLDKPLQYQLTTTNSEQSWFVFMIKGMEGKMAVKQMDVMNHSMPGLPSWLNANARAAFALQNQQAPLTLDLHLTKEPTKVTFFVDKVTGKAQHFPGMRFDNHQTFTKNPNNPPFDKQPLYTAGEAITAPWPADLTPKIGKHGTFELPFTDAMRGVCQLSVSGKDTSSIEWMGKHDSGHGLLSNHQPMWLLGQLPSTPVTTHLHCDGTPSWQRTDYKSAANTPWLVPLARFGDVAQMTVGDFYQHYRALDGNGEPLMLTNAHTGEPALQNDSLEAISANGQLKFAGFVAGIAKVVTSGPAIDKSWPMPLSH
ncbi:hypothetical protein [Gallaecimonas mangrovi]|uniref:hypothetical protein n=1 Tax=Gallaecimonas mangrovi TaxID=2291597 RepID=UPI000E20224C|nr:hypothetical protein [Gallaecimonas mangrovi]